MWVDPEIAWAQGNNVVYRTYKDDEYESPWSYWYTTDVTEWEDAFDVRELAKELGLSMKTPLHIIFAKGFELGLLPYNERSGE